MWSLLEWLQDGGLEPSEDMLTLMASGSYGVSPGTPVGTVASSQHVNGFKGICLALEVKQCHLCCILFARNATEASQPVVRGKGIRTLLSMGKVSENFRCSGL